MMFARIAIFRLKNQMIESAEQFRSLLESDEPNEYHRAAHDEASLEVWLDVVSRMPTMRFWVAQNKTRSFRDLG